MNKHVIDRLSSFTTANMRGYRAPDHYAPTPKAAAADMAPSAPDTRVDASYVAELRQAQNPLQKAVLNGVPFRQDNANGIREDLLLNKVKAQKLSPTPKEFQQVLDGLVGDRRLKKVTRQRQTFWMRLK